MSPLASDIRRYIEGFLDVNQIAYEADEPEMIDVLALTINIEVVEAFIKDNSIFEKLDAIEPQIGR